MALTSITLPARSNPGRFGPDDAARLINCYAEDAGPDGKSKLPIHVNSGWETFAALTGQGIIRAGLVLNGAIYCVAGDKACKVSASGVITVLGTVGGPDLTKLVTMDRNRKVTPQICITVDNFVYLIESDVLSTLVDVDLQPDVNSVTHIDGYFVLFCDSGTFQLTSIDEGSTIDALDFSTASAHPDGGVRCASRNRDLVLFGSESVEFWSNTGGTFPFTRTTSATGPDAGLLAAGSVAALNQTLAYVASDRTVRMLNGYTPTRISTHSVERSISGDPDPAAITALAWTEDGHVRYEVSGTDYTWIYDATNGTWTEAKSYGYDRSRAGVYINLDGRHIFGDFMSGRLFERAKRFFDESGDPIVWEVRMSPVHDFPRRLKHNALFIDVMTGAAGTPSAEPQIMVDYSDDGGKTFSTQRLLSLGLQGQRMKTVKTLRLGRSGPQGRVYRLSGSAAHATCILDVRIEAEALKVHGN